MPIVYGSVCSGIEAATVAWEPLGWTPAFFSEIEPFPRAVLAHHWPEVPLHGDFTTIEAGQYRPIDLLVGGTPCQSFSVAGLRGGLGDDRGNLALEYLRLADRLRPRWLVWENVPGVLSSNGGRDFGAILGGMVELGYGFAYRVLDAQFFGVAQRRRRVFVVGHLGDWRRAAAVLFERHSLQGHPAPRREAGQRPAPTISARPTGGGGPGTDFDLDGGLIAAFGGNDTRGPIDVSTALNSHGGPHGGPHGRLDFESETFVAHTLKGEGFDASEGETGRGTPIVPVAVAHAFDARQSGVLQYGDWTGPLDTDGHSLAIYVSSKDHGADAEVDLSPTLRAGGHAASHANAGVPPAVAFAMRGRDGGAQAELGGEVSNALRTPGGGASVPMVALQGSMFGLSPTAGPAGPGWDDSGASFTQTKSDVHGVAGPGLGVRRLTPTECERLQGFPDGHTAITYRGKPAADGPRYKALGNSMAVPCMAWIGRRIAMVDEIGEAS